jgi:hypothetical protein
MLCNSAVQARAGNERNEMNHTSRITNTVLAVCLLSPLTAGSLWAQRTRVELETRPERSEYRETSSYADVVAFVEEAADAAPWMHLTTLGYTLEGRALPVVVVGDVADASAEAVMASGKVRMFVQANIHAGEVCGKEAMLMLLRALANGEHSEWRESLVLLIAPIYNADGNERVSLTNRRSQNGPVAGMGQRANAQGLDLNRDNMKLDSPEAHSLVSFWQRYDPHIVMDLHTTNGPRHAYHLTYAPPLHPNTDAGLIELLRGDWLPEVRRAIEEKYGWHYYYYGFLPWRGSDAERGWYTFSHQPRFLTNYVGLRNRIGILSEAYSYATFEERILASLRFVEEVANYAQRNASEIQRVVEAADAAATAGTEMGLRATYERSSEPVEILMGEVEQKRNPYSGQPILERLDAATPESMPEFGTFRSTESEVAPAAYLVPSELRNVLAVLDDHGIEWSRLEAERTVTVQRFVIDSMAVAEREYQNHKQRTLFGHYEEVESAIPAGTAVVPVDQPLGRLAFLLLEPRSDDGLANWNFMDAAVEEARHYPVLRAAGW